MFERRDSPLSEPFPAAVAARYSALGEGDLAHLRSGLQMPFTIASGIHVLRRGRADNLHVLQDGWACKYEGFPDGRRQITVLHLPGDIVDLGRIVEPGSTCNVIALTACRVERIPVAWIRATLDTHPAIRNLFLNLLLRENDALAANSVRLGRRNARERIASFFCDLVERLQLLGLGDRTSFQVHMTQMDMADMLGLSTVHLNRQLQTLKSEGLLSARGRTHAISDLETLRGIALSGECDPALNT